MQIDIERERAAIIARFGAQVAGRRRELGLRQQDLAKFIGRAPYRVVKIEAGEAKPQLAEAVLIARALGVSLEDLVEE